METLARHMLEPIVAHPDALKMQTVDGESVVLIEVIVHDEDRERLEQDKGRALRSIRTVLSAAAGRRKATLDLVDEFGPASGEE